MNPRNVLLKGQKASAAGTPHISCLAEASTNDAVRTHYQSLCEGFVVKITDFGLAPHSAPDWSRNGITASWCTVLHCSGAPATTTHPHCTKF